MNREQRKERRERIVDGFIYEEQKSRRPLKGSENILKRY